MKRNKVDQKTQAWIDARKRHRLSHAQVQMACELGLNPKKLGGMDNHQQEPWKIPLAQFIEEIYFKRFGKERPDLVLSLEEKSRLDGEKKAQKREAKLERKQSGTDEAAHPQGERMRCTEPQSGDGGGSPETERAANPGDGNP
jgi:hypothetical protein